MLNIKWIRENPEQFDKAMLRRGSDVSSVQVLALDADNRGAQGDLQALQTRANELAKLIGPLMGQGKKEEAQVLMDESKSIKAQVASLKDGGDKPEGTAAENPVTKLLETLPNIMDADVPDGKSEDDNVEVRKWGELTKLNFAPKPHYEVGEGLGAATVGSQLDFEHTANISGARFATLKGDLAKMERALSNFMLDVHTAEFDYEEVSPPLLTRPEAMYGTGQLPKFEEDAFKTTDGKWLISTSEIVLANQVREMILDEVDLPYRMVAYTPCFRSEAGSAGKDTRGLIRMHQFNKVEMVTVTTAEESTKELERKTGCAEAILQRLGLPYRVMLLCAGDTGFAARKTYDLEVWLPAQNTYREISSCSNCGEFQGRRMNARYRIKGEKQTQFVHTLNGSGLAVGRTMVAVLENYQNEDGSVTVPEVLVSYMGGQTLIKSAS
jgi:seryl-tRNA synthetase